ncbi:MAG: hypothetical protein ABW007_10205 [Chitinophagaceae bacterium]
MNVWIFNGSKGRFPSGVFTKRELAEKWIELHQLSGTLTSYPVDTGIYEWAIERSFFTISNEKQKLPEFIESFSSGSLEHYHYENGKLD